MRAFLFGVTSGTIAGLALGVWLGSSPVFPLSEWREYAQGEAFYHGRPISSWLLQFEDRDPIYRQEAIQALETIGARGEGAVAALAAALKDRVAVVRICAAGALRRLGPDARPALPALLTALEDEDALVRTNAAAALGVSARGNRP
jgi:HEAT repeat protein